MRLANCSASTACWKPWKPAPETTRKTLKDALLAAVWKHTGGKMSHDDVTFMVVELAAGHS